MNSDNNDSQKERELATLAGGCFWCLETVFLELKGIEKVISGYTGGTEETATYHQVSSGSTGHAEAVQLLFHPHEIRYRDILDIFFTMHDPTTLNRQGADVGSQYRSEIFYHSTEQKEIAEHVIEELNMSQTWGRPVVTEIVPYKMFYPAEEYHQDFYARNPGQPYCHIIIDPKVAKLRKHFFDKLKKASNEEHFRGR